jgi:hypothetical protein
MGADVPARLSRQRIAAPMRVHPARAGYHLVIARRQDPDLEPSHQAATATKDGPSHTDLGEVPVIRISLRGRHIERQGWGTR